MKLYLVFALDKESHETYLCDIFSNPKKANDYAEERNKDTDRLLVDKCTVEEWEIQE